MLEDERNVPRRIQIRNKLDVARESIVGQRLQLRRRERVRLDHRGSALVLEVALELEDESVDLVERSLRDGGAQRLGPVQVMSVIPVDESKAQVGPVDDSAFGQPQGSVVARGDQLEKRLHAAKEPWGGIGRDRDAAGRQLQKI